MTVRTGRLVGIILRLCLVEAAQEVSARLLLDVRRCKRDSEETHQWHDERKAQENYPPACSKPHSAPPVLILRVYQDVWKTEIRGGVMHYPRFSALLQFNQERAPDAYLSFLGLLVLSPGSVSALISSPLLTPSPSESLGSMAFKISGVSVLESFSSALTSLP